MWASLQDFVMTGGWHEWLSVESALLAVKVLVTFLLASFAAPVARRAVVKITGVRFGAQQVALAARVVTYIIWGLATASVLKAFGYGEVLTAALTTAGFASFGLTYSAQTSVSQIISGLFLIGEQPFGIGDTITSGAITGEVLSIDPLSVKVRTPDNLHVRIPNNAVISNTLTNISRYPIRRLDMQISVAYRCNIEAVRNTLFDVARRNPLCLEDPKPLFIFAGFGASSIDLTFCVWGRREYFNDLKSSMYIDVKETFDKEGIEIPYPHRTLVAASGGSSVSLGPISSNTENSK